MPGHGDVAVGVVTALLQQPDGFEGLGAIEVCANSRDLAALQREDRVMTAIHFHSARPSEIPLMDSGENTITSIGDLLDREVDDRERGEQVTEELPDPLVAVIDAADSLG